MLKASWKDTVNERLILLNLSNESDQKNFLEFLANLKSELQAQGNPDYRKIEEFLEFANSGADWTNLDRINQLFENQVSVSFTGPDPDFGPEFADKYQNDLNEISEWVSTKAMEDNPDYDEIAKKVKRFVHTLKGDAGSVGFYQIEKSCHNFESILPELVEDNLIDTFLNFSRFCTTVIDKWKFENVWTEDIWTPSSGAEVNKGDQVSEEKIDLSVFGESANVELLKELLNDPEYADLIKKELNKPKDGKYSEPNFNQANINEISAEPKPQKIPSKDSTEFNTYSLEGDPELYAEFTLEAEDHLSNVENALMSNPENEVDLIFRCVHSIKGASGFFKFRELQEISHILENLLDDVRNKKKSFTEDLKGCLALYIDISRNLLERGKKWWKDNIPLEWSLEGIKLFKLLESIKSGEAPVQQISPTFTEETKTSNRKESKESEKPFVKVDTVRLDHLIDSIGEMCIYTNMLVRQARIHLKDNIEVLDVTHQVEKFARELQEVGIALRLVPVKGLFQKMARLVWDLAKKTGKQIVFEMFGEDTELDRNIIEKLTDPLLHMVRNCVDHGIETPDERVKQGKPKEGRISLEASHKGGTIQIILRDDGRGLDPDKIFSKAVERGLVSKDQKLTKDEIFSLIFMPGFSTAEKVTELSGRGVGMDVVRRNVSDLRGRILIESEKGQGTSFTIELPLTLAILDGIMIRVHNEVYLVPTLAVVEIVDVGNDIFLTNEKGLTFNFRGQYLALYNATELFNCPNIAVSDIKTFENKKVLVLENGTERIALLVDEVLESFTTVIKSIDKYVGNRKGISGCSVMSDGSVALIIDVRELIDLAKQQTKERMSHTYSANNNAN